MPKAIRSPWTLAGLAALIARAARPGVLLVRKDSVVHCSWARVPGGGSALNLEVQPPLLGGRSHSRRWRGGCQRRRRDDGSAKRSGRRGWSCGASGGRGRDERRPESQARRSASIHCAVFGSGEGPGGVFVGRDRPDEGFLPPEEGPEQPMEGPRRRKSPSWSSVKGTCRMIGMRRERVGTSPPTSMPDLEGSQGVKPQ